MSKSNMFFKKAIISLINNKIAYDFPRHIINSDDFSILFYGDCLLTKDFELRYTNKGKTLITFYGSISEYGIIQITGRKVPKMKYESIGV